MGTFPEPGPPVVVVGYAVPTRGQGDRAPAPAWARGPGRAENDRAMGFAGMARSYRKIERFRDILGHGSHHHPPVPAEMAATCGRSGPCPRNHPIKRFRSVRRHGRPHLNIRRFRHVRGHGPLLQKNRAFSGCSGPWVAPSSPVPTEMVATCGRSGPCPRWCLPSCTLAAPLVVEAACSCPHTMALTTSCIAGMARSYRKIARLSVCSRAWVAPPSPVPTEMAATCGWSGPCPRNNRIKPKSHSSTGTPPSVAPTRPEADWPAHTGRPGAHPPRRAGHDRETPAATTGRACP